MFRSLFVFLLVVFFISSSFASKVELEVYNVGQGNCVLVKTQHKKGSPRYMLVDIGSSAHKKELAYTKLLSPLKDEETENQTPSSDDSSLSFSGPQSIVKVAFPHQDLESDEQSWNSSKRNKKKGEDEGSFIEKLRKKLEKKQPKKEKIKVSSIHIQTVVITHPDTDHYKWLTKLFSKKTDHIEHIIFGGRPENYDSKGTLNFEQWINDRLKNNSKVYFPAIQSNPIKTLKEVLPSTERTYAQHFYTKSKEKEERFGKAFEFGEDIDVFCLSVNPTHFVGKGNEVLRMSDSEDDNADSLVLKLQCGDLSAILSGDATGVTTTRILNNYHKNKEFLKTNLLLASHHGSVTHESNNKEWIEATQPEFVVISNGLFHGHPHDGAYQNFKKSPRLKKVTNHKVLVGEFDNQWSMHHTQNAIFSTLTNGIMTFVLEDKKEIKIISEKQTLLEVLKYGRKKDKKEAISFQEGNDKIIVSPLPKKIQQKRMQKNEAKVIKSHDFNEEKKKIDFSNESEEKNKENTQIKKRKDREENKKPSKKPKKEKLFTHIFEGEKIQFREKEVPEDGDCGYSALGMNRKAATELLLRNIQRAVIRNLIAPEIYDMLPQLPKDHPVVKLSAYQLNLAQQDNLAGPYQKICNRLNNLFQRKEGERWSGDQLWECYQKNLLDIQQHTQKNEAYKSFIAIREQIRKNEEERMQFCSQQETVKCYIENFMQIPVHSYYKKYDDNNWLNYCPILMNDGKYRTYAINAIAYLLKKNLIIIHESGELRHKYKFSVTPMTLNNTLFLRHIGNYHFNTLIPSGEKDK